MTEYVIHPVHPSDTDHVVLCTTKGGLTEVARTRKGGTQLVAVHDGRTVKVVEQFDGPAITEVPARDDAVRSLVDAGYIALEPARLQNVRSADVPGASSCVAIA